MSAKTISTHNGSAAHRAHNIRASWAIDKQPHIDQSLSCNNVILHDEDPRAAYQRIFGDALNRYNAKQQRPERQIRDYYSHVKKNANKHPVYELIVQIGDKNDTGLDAPTERECLLQFYNTWKDRNPNLECIGAYVHADEKDGTIHMHLDYVPVAHGYTRGLDTQTGLVKALGEMGFHKCGKETAQIQWQRRENQALEEICLEHGIEVCHPGLKRPHMQTELYKLSKQVEVLENKKNRLEREIGLLRGGLLDALGYDTVIDAFKAMSDEYQDRALIEISHPHLDPRVIDVLCEAYERMQLPDIINPAFDRQAENLLPWQIRDAGWDLDF